MQVRCEHCGSIIERPDRYIKRVYDLNGQYLAPEFIKEKVCEYFRVKFEDIDKKSRKTEIVYIRQVYMAFLKKKTKLSNRQVAETFSKALTGDHTTVIHSLQRIDDLMCTERKVLDDVININELLNK